MTPKTRVFLVGCPRSGTTLLQSLLAAHPEIATFPESHFFQTVVPRRRSLRVFGVASRRARPRFERFLGELGCDEERWRLPASAVMVRRYVAAFVGLLDSLAQQQGKSAWLEKTPRHLRYIKCIEKFVEGASFIHIVRDGADVVTSLYEVTHEHPGVWGGAMSLERCVGRWIEDVRISRDHLHKPNHALVRYERLVQDPEAVLTELCGFLGVEFSEAMLLERSAAAKRVVLESEPWKASVGGAIANANSKKFFELFDEAQRKYVLSRLSAVDLDEELPAGAGEGA